MDLSLLKPLQREGGCEATQRDSPVRWAQEIHMPNRPPSLTQASEDQVRTDSASLTLKLP